MRDSYGMSLIEMLSTIFITAFVGMMMCEIAVTQNVVALKTSNKLDALIGARRFVPQFLRDVHMAQSFVEISNSTPTCTPTLCVINVSNFATDGSPLSTVTPVVYSVQAGTTADRYQLVRTTPTDSKVLVTDIVGPIAVGAPSNSTPQVFRYFEQSAIGLSNPGVNGTNVVGVRVTLEVAGAQTLRSEIDAKTFAFSTDAVARWNFK